MPPPTLRVCLVDMHNGVPNQGIRCLRRLIEGLRVRAAAANAGLTLELRHVQPRNLGELPWPDADLVLSSGGPGSPYDGYEDAWCTGWRRALDRLVEANLRAPQGAPRAFLVCHSFELAVLHYAVARMTLRPQGRKFGIMPAYPTAEGRASPLFAGFGDRLFVFEHRHWEAREPDPQRMRELGCRLLARESREGRDDKGSALLAFDFAPGVSGVQFHPEADRAGVLAWVANPEQAADLRQAYGDALYARMRETLDNPGRVARTFALLIPGWLTRAFNDLARARGWKSIAPPIQDLTEFQPPAASAV